jgi:hypothetical protein
VDGRVGLVMGGVSTVAASVAVICAVAISNSASLADSAGASVSAAGVVVPASPFSTPTASESAPGPETLPAPSPSVVDPPQAMPAVSDSEAPVSPVAPAGAQHAVAAGRWDEVRSWASAHGWSAERIDAWVQGLQAEAERRSIANRPDHDDHREKGPNEKRADQGQSAQDEWGRLEADRQSAERQPAPAPEPAPLPAEPAPLPPDPAQLAPEQPSSRPAHAGPNSPPAHAGPDHEQRPNGPGSNKDRSRDSPDRRGR